MGSQKRWQIAVVRRVFPSWSIAIPPSFEEAYLEEGGGYWHAYDLRRSVSLTSVQLTDRGQPVPAEEIMRTIPPLEGSPVRRLPEGLVGHVVETVAPASSRASRILTGMLAADGRMLILTITGNDRRWARRTLQTIRLHPEAAAQGPEIPRLPTQPMSIARRTSRVL